MEKIRMVKGGIERYVTQKRVVELKEKGFAIVEEDSRKKNAKKPKSGKENEKKAETEQTKDPTGEKE